MNNNIENLSKWYLDHQLDFDKTLINFRYQSIKKWFNGKSCWKWDRQKVS